MARKPARSDIGEAGAAPPARERPIDQRLRRLTALAGLLGRAGGLLVGPRLSGAQRRRLRVRWARHVPQLARRLADLLERDPTALLRQGLTAEGLRGAEQEILLLTGLMAALDELTGHVADLLILRKAALYDEVQGALGVLRARIDGPLAEPEAARALRALAEPVLAQDRDRRREIQKRRQALRALRAGAEARPARAAEPPRLSSSPATGMHGLLSRLLEDGEGGTDA